MNKRSISMLIAGSVLTCGVATTVAVSASTGPTGSGAPARAMANIATPKTVKQAAPRPVTKATLAVVRAAAPAPKLPSGVSTATSFWGGQTASGRPMTEDTIASPYWPLGTQVKITYQGKSTVGVVWDFGPAQFAVAQHNPPALIDLSEEMMAKLTGVSSNSITVKFQVLHTGSGRVYRHSGVGYDRAMK